jgi:cobalt-zinc-cadmium resistance protein CzcA
VALVVTGPVAEHDPRPLRALRRWYGAALARALVRPRLVVASAAVAFGLSLLLFTRLGQEFVPRLAELDIVVMATRVPSTSLEESTRMQRALERELRARTPEAEVVFSRTGTPDTAMDPMPPYLSDTFLVLKPRSEWPNPGDTKEDVRRRVEAVTRTVPGNSYEFTQPIEMRFNELLAGVRSDLAVKVFGDDFDQLLPAAEAVARELGTVRGAADVRVEEVEGAPVLSIEPRRDVLARYGLTVADVHEAAAIAVAGRPAGAVFQGDRRFDVVVRLGDELRRDPAALDALPIVLSHADPPVGRIVLAADDVARFEPRVLPLGAVADVTLEEGPNQISRENGKRRIVVQANVRGRDLASFVAEARARIVEAVPLPPGTWLGWGGQYENLVSARRRLAVVVPACFLLILVLLYGTFGSLARGLLVFSAVPLALTGGVAALWLRDLPFSISAAVGFIALSGVAVLNGLVLVTFVEELRGRGLGAAEAVMEGAVTRLRPVLVTALVASLGFVPMALATGTGAEVQRPLATVVVGGLLSSTALTLFVLPALYLLAAPAVVAPGRGADTPQ